MGRTITGCLLQPTKANKSATIKSGARQAEMSMVFIGEAGAKSVCHRHPRTSKSIRAPLGLRIHEPQIPHPGRCEAGIPDPALPATLGVKGGPAQGMPVNQIRGCLKLRANYCGRILLIRPSRLSPCNWDQYKAYMGTSKKSNHSANACGIGYP